MLSKFVITRTRIGEVIRLKNNDIFFWNTLYNTYDLGKNLANRVSSA